jgi:hypothetical protein
MGGATIMSGWVTQATLERLKTGDVCEENRCFELAVWSVTFNDESAHLCSRHTRMQMKDSTRWAEAFSSKVIG